MWDLLRDLLRPGIKPTCLLQWQVDSSLSDQESPSPPFLRNTLQHIPVMMSTIFWGKGKQKVDKLSSPNFRKILSAERGHLMSWKVKKRILTCSHELRNDHSCNHSCLFNANNSWLFLNLSNLVVYETRLNFSVARFLSLSQNTDNFRQTWTYLRSTRKQAYFKTEKELNRFNTWPKGIYTLFFLLRL